MLVFGHSGITLAIAILLSRSNVKAHTLSIKSDALHEKQLSLPKKLSWQHCFNVAELWLTSLASRIDIRLLLIGSLLPDIVDKPLGLFILRDTFANGTIFCHSLLFLVIITLVGVYLYYKYKKTWFLVLAFGTLTHLILDGMWWNTQTLLWPLFGFSFERYDPKSFGDWIRELLHDLLVYPAAFVLEILGAIIVFWFIWRLVRRKKLSLFIRNGQI